MKKALYFFQYLPPWKIDVFNGIAAHYDLTVVFFDIDRNGFTYDREDLLGRLDGVGVEILDGGVKIFGHPFRKGIGRLLGKYRPDVVFVHEFSPVTVELLHRRKNYGYRVYLTTSDNLEMAKESRGLVRMVRNKVFRKVDGAIFYSEAVRAYYKERYPSLRSFVCPNIQKPETLLRYREEFPSVIPDLKERYGIAEDERIILYIGRLVHVKGLDLLLAAFAGANLPGKLVLVGEGECREALENQAEALGIKDRVVFTGFLFGARLYAWYDMADFFILPSRMEPFGAVVNEALVYGCPVVASDRIGALDFLDEENGIVFNPEDPEDFARAIKSASERFHLASGGSRKSLMRLSFEQYLSAYLNIDQ